MPVEFWFEFASTYSYPAAMRVESLCLAAAVPLRWRPFLLGPIFAAQNWTDSPFNLYPVKGRYMWRDLERICTALGLPLRRPTKFPRNGLLAARIACLAAAEEAAWLPAFVRAVYRANFADDREIGDAAVLGEILAELGQPAAEVLAAAQSPENKVRLRGQTEEAVRRGLCGAPSFTVGDELFWGNDRLEAALDWCRRDPGEDAAIDAVLTYWFGPAAADAAALAERQARWFRATAEVDDEIRARFAALVGDADRGVLDHWQATARGRLALILLLDQFPRHIHRGQALAFAGDRKAVALALGGIDAGLDRQLDVLERAFFYLPLQHAEDAAIQERSVAAGARLLVDSPPALRETAAEFLAAARGHRDLVARFGRFPHRNACLGRPSTAEERQFLAAGGRRFGQ